MIKCKRCLKHKIYLSRDYCFKCYKYIISYDKKEYRVNIGNYYAIYKPFFKYSNKFGRVTEHRYIYHIYLSIKYNRIIYLPKSYDVHHINENTRDNSIKNLQLLSKKQHNIIHHSKS